MNATIRISPRSGFGFFCAIVVDGVNVARTWRASPADALRHACAVAGLIGGYVIPRTVDTSVLYSGSAVAFSVEVS